MRSIASASRALPSAERWERPSTRVSILSSDQPGGFGQGPDEKLGRAGFRAGRGVVNVTLLAESARRVGTAWPTGRCKGVPVLRKRFVKDSRTLAQFAQSCVDEAPFASTHRKEPTTRPAGAPPWLNLLTIRSEFHLWHERGVFPHMPLGLGSSFIDGS